ncbi:MAG: homoprotocatechuate degradation operon regulator HpaR [Gammaproteobacteria bacterium]|nr:homoprotocatechuate degradation operon regulator HpaR [Gammaproteobacteria bacterium]MDH3428424.1 homoprotocatechuate degradation operon regulator HpaR [Gammaproteobacteria bacterium]MDH3434340.1 homoprotocatechuate degradation operon regulator HpaR [Gammaproteobacteria bacterium]
MTNSGTRGNAGTLRDFRHSLPMELLRAREAAMARFRPMLREHGLTEQQWRVIRALADGDRLDASELARRSYLLAPSLTRILQFLEKEGLVKRSSDSRDQRRSVLALTAKGRRVFNRVGPDSEIRYAEIEAQFGRDRLNTLYELLADFYTTLDSADS